MIALYTRALVALRDLPVPYDASSQWKLGFGKVQSSTLVEWVKPVPAIAMILLANLPHAIFSGLYLLYNNIYTRMLAELEWNRFSQRGTKEGILLRVTQPEGRQRSKYFLSLPYRYAIALMVQSIIVHWFVSQSLFLLVYASTIMASSKQKKFQPWDFHLWR